MTSYRADVDGLRAIAVLLVVGYHFFPTLVPGGFVGVDIFFVISGYLISTIAIRSVTDRTFTFASFYARRAKRLLPALFAVSLVALVVYTRLFYARQIVEALHELTASTLFSANLYFFATADYFGPASSELPFLHFWSLGVEEQYYVLFPVLVIALRRFPPRVQIVSYAIIVIASLAGSEIVVRTQPPAAYYLLPWRAWELGVGTLLAFAVPSQRLAARFAEPLFWLGIGAIAYSLAALDDRAAFPGINALPVCFGAAAIILAGCRAPTVGSRLLGSAPMTALGRISYSLYLVHWPIFVIGSASVFQGRLLSNPIVMLGLSLALGALSYFALERPVRRLRGVSDSRILMVAGTVAVVALLALFATDASYQATIDRATRRASMVRPSEPRHLDISLRESGSTPAGAYVAGALIALL